MSAITSILIASFLLVCILHQGNAHTITEDFTPPCSINNITVVQKQTSQIIQGNPQYQVTVANDCICTQSAVLVYCTGFNSFDQVDPKVFRSNGDGECIVNDGQPVISGSPTSFTYAQTPAADLTAASSIVSCS
ncbi:TPD1 protein homolog 1-like [Dioscorea cayenensis subsp. rotundata]|uniref:TPD1 protein homolog 1-like n=1 Tax=Dioscorea cayennensis subsp. rotundata TaxID=55577 RepID=A0AB40BA86_DIOCR|nr:TPD1 protein homolog 1-like [Dioscorea cayenensis subsp. rotundata]